MVSIGARGNIRVLTCQETHHLDALFRAGCCLRSVAACSPKPGEVRAATPPSFANPGPRARVVTVQEADALDAFRPRPAVIRAMVDRGITNLTGKASLVAAWRSLVSTQDVVGIKVFSSPGPNSGTRPDVVAAVVEGLLAAGVPPKHIIVWDRETADLRLAGYFDLAERYGIRVAGSAQAGWDDKSYYETEVIGNLVYGDHEFGLKGDRVGRKSFVSKLVSREMTKIISITPLLNHNEVGVSGHIYGLATGSVDNLVRFEGMPDRIARCHSRDLRAGSAQRQGRPQHHRRPDRSIRGRRARSAALLRHPQPAPLQQGPRGAGHAFDPGAGSPAPRRRSADREAQPGPL